MCCVVAGGWNCVNYFDMLCCVTALGSCCSSRTVGGSSA